MKLDFVQVCVDIYVPGSFESMNTCSFAFCSWIWRIFKMFALIVLGYFTSN